MPRPQETAAVSQPLAIEEGEACNQYRVSQMRHLIGLSAAGQGKMWSCSSGKEGEREREEEIPHVVE